MADKREGNRGGNQRRGIAQASAEALANTPEGKRSIGEYMQGRRSMAMEMADQGLLSSARLGMEILYLLPDGFVNFYSEIFHRALRVNDGSVMHGRAGGLEKSKGQTGMALGSENQLQSSGTGKKYKNTGLVIGSEEALLLKTKLDQGLAELMRDTQDLMRDLRQGRVRDQAGVRDNPTSPDDGSIEMSVGKVGGKAIQCRGEGKMVPAGWDSGGRVIGTTRTKCGKFLKSNWVYCPACGTKREGS